MNAAKAYYKYSALIIIQGYNKSGVCSKLFITLPSLSCLILSPAY